MLGRVVEHLAGARAEAWLIRVAWAVVVAYRWLRPRPTGVLVGTLFFGMSLTPSLLPRPWLAQGLISGIALVIGYAIGSVLGRLFGLVRRVPAVGLRRRPPFRVRGRLFVAGVVVVVLASVYQGSAWQRELYLLMDQPAPSRLTYLRVPAVALLMLGGGVALWRAAADVARFVVRRVQRWIPPGPLQVFGVTIALVAVAVATERIALGSFLTVAGRVSAQVNDGNIADQPPPERGTRSGGPGSLVTWESLGAEGRWFVTRQPTRDDLRAFARAAGLPGQDLEPIRVYVGLEAAADAPTAADLAVLELERTGAFSRSVLCVVTTTGTGWIDPYLSAALEYMHGGDIATVGVQYSYLPSWISFLTERDRVTQAGPELFEKVYARWSRLPAGDRPKLVVFAESLGSLGSEAGFSGLDDVAARTDGVIWSGPTNANPLWRHLVANREPGTPEVLPVYDGGRTVRFVSRPEDLARPAAAWPTPRVVYLQNPSDPVTWWTPALLWDRPDWLAEPRGRDVLPAMRWFPVVTFVQVTADLALAYGAPPGHGHQFHESAVAAWAAVTDPPGWTPHSGALLGERLGP